MTRETKVGLLVGLGFIVVFAVLLSQTTSVPSTGENSSVVMNPTHRLPSLPGSGDAVSRPAGSFGDRTVPGTGTVRTPGGPSAAPDSGTIRLANGTEPVRKTVDGAGSQLPNPTQLGQSPLDWMASKGSGTQLSGAVAPDHGDTSLVSGAAADRKVPPPSGTTSVGLIPFTITPVAKHAESPEPVTRIAESVKSTTPEPPSLPKSPVSEPAQPQQEYVVQKGDTLRSIAKERYDSVSAKVVEFVATTNKERIKDKNRVFEGQKLVLPDLPPDMFEVVQPSGAKKPSLKELATDLATADARKIQKDSSKSKTTSAGSPPSLTGTSPVKASTETADASASSSPQVVDYPKLTPRKRTPTLTPVPPPTSTPIPPANGVDDRRAPTFVVKNDEASLKSKLTLNSGETKPANSSSRYRTYEVRDKDTLGSIAAKELGTATAWAQIQKLNKDLDPKKMRPGMKIKLPAKQPGSSPDGTSARPETSRASV